MHIFTCVVCTTQENARQRNTLSLPHQQLSGRPRANYTFDESIELLLQLAADPRKVGACN